MTNSTSTAVNGWNLAICYISRLLNYFTTIRSNVCPITSSVITLFDHFKVVLGHVAFTVPTATRSVSDSSLSCLSCFIHFNDSMISQLCWSMPDNHYTVFRKKHPLTISFIFLWMMCRFKQEYYLVTDELKCHNLHSKYPPFSLTRVDSHESSTAFSRCNITLHQRWSNLISLLWTKRCLMLNYLKFYQIIHHMTA